VDPDAAALVAAAQAPDGVLNAPPHSRVMQYEYFHVCQGIFFHGLSKLFGGLFTQELLAAGAHICPADSNFAIGGIYASAQSEKLAEPARIGARLSRAAYETLLRRMVCADKRVQFVDGTILGFDVDPQDPKRLAGVRYRPTGDAKATLTLKGKLIIGRSSHLFPLGLHTDSSTRLQWRLTRRPELSPTRISGLRLAQGHLGVVLCEDSPLVMHV
jgi:hypothetical protein